MNWRLSVIASGVRRSADVKSPWGPRPLYGAIPCPTNASLDDQPEDCFVTPISLAMTIN